MTIAISASLSTLPCSLSLIRRMTLRFIVATIFTLFASGFAAAQTAGTSEKPYDFYSRGPYRPSISRPSTILGYEAGERHTTFREQEQVIQSYVASASERVRLFDYGKSTENRPLRLLAISSPENLLKLEEIRSRIARLADPRKLASPAEAETILKNTPTLIWINQCIHGDETASFESAMWLIYNLVASENPQITEALKNAVILVNPVYNPDGHERFVVNYNSVALGSPDSFSYERRTPWASVGRYNHYRFDMNRDKLSQSQPETRAETAALLSWNPQVYVDQHGQPPVYFFPPNALPTLRFVDRQRVTKWTEIFGKANATAFDSQGWAYVNRETYDFFYPGYLDSFSTLTGAIGMTYETDGGGNLARRRADGTISTLRDAVSHHLESALTTIFTAAGRREELLRDYLAYHRAAMEGKGEKVRCVVLPPTGDSGRRAELASLLTRVGVEVRQINAPFVSASAQSYRAINLAKPTSSRREFPAGSLVIDLNQPRGNLARAFLETDTNLETNFLKEQLARRERNEKRNENEPRESYEFYDLTGWALPLAYDVEGYRTGDAPPTTGVLLTADAAGNVRLSKPNVSLLGKASVAYLFRGDTDGALILALRLSQEKYRVSVATKPISSGGKDWPRGTIILRVSRNPETLHGRLSQLSAELDVDVFSLSSTFTPDGTVGIGSENVTALARPKIAVAAGDNVSQTGYGAVWNLLEKSGIQFTAIPLRSMNAENLARFNTVILPDGVGYAGAFGKSGIADLKAWISHGGAVLGLADGGRWFMDKDVELTTARRVGEDDPKGEKDKEPKSVVPASGKNAAKAPAPKKPLELPGAIFRAKIDPTHFLGWAYPSGELPVFLSGDVFLKPSTGGANVVTFGKAPLVLTGFVWPDNTEALLADTAFIIDEPIGSGHAILYLDDPTFRALWPGMRRLFLAGMLYAPSGGAGVE
jgi:hypothetical protein